jgi:hypothetical protein
MAVNVGEKMQDFINSLLNDREFAHEYAGDPHGKLVAEGVTDYDLSSVDVPSAVREVCADPSVSPETRSALQSYSGGSSGPAHSAGTTQSVEQVVQHLNYVTYQTYEGDDYITNLIDNSVDVDVTGNVFGDVDVNAVTGDQGQIIDGPNFGQANTGDGAVLAGDDASGVNTGVNTGINAGDDVENAVVGNNNETAQISGSADGSAIGFGNGDVNNLPNADIDDSAVSFGGGAATNVSGNTVDDGSAIAVGGSASGTNVEDNDTTVTTTVEDNDTTVIDNDTTVSDNDTTVTAVQDNDTIQSGDDTTFATQ